MSEEKIDFIYTPTFQALRRCYLASLSSRKNYLSKKQPKEDFDLLFRELKAFEIIKNKGVAVGMIQLLVRDNCGGVNEYNDFIGDKKLYLTQEEFDLLKEELA